jgi:O-6-methylguanine DNA methyltransferase
VSGDENKQDINNQTEVSMLVPSEDDSINSVCQIHISMTLKWLQKYFAGQDDGTAVPSLCLQDITHYRAKVYQTLLRTKPGETLTYKELSDRVSGDAGKGSRAVGNAMRDNPFILLVGCHRVIPSSKKTTGVVGNYLHGSELKKRLIDFEKRYYLK